MKALSSICAALLVAAGFAGAASAAATQGPAMSPLPAQHANATMAEKGVQVADAGDFGAGVAVGVIGSLIAQGVAEERARRISDEEWRWEECDREFRSFEWDTGMYTTYGGERRICPYLLD